MALRSAWRNPGRSAATFAGALAALVLVFVSWGMLDSMQNVLRQQFREAQPGSVFLETADYVTDGLAYITSPDGLKNNRPQIEAYMRAIKGAMEQIVDDGPEFTDTIKKLRSKYDFAELKSDTVAKYYLKYNSDNWMLDGREQLLKVDKEKWKKTYDDAVKVKAAKGGVDVTQNVVEGVI